MNIQIDIEETINEDIIGNMDMVIAKQLDYQENYKLCDLKKIAEYYDISVRKLKKEHLINEIIAFESDPENITTVNERLHAWYWLNEFSNNIKLKKYIFF